MHLSLLFAVLINNATVATCNLISFALYLFVCLSMLIVVRFRKYISDLGWDFLKTSASFPTNMRI